MSSGETLAYMKNKKSIYSRDNDFITIIASAKNNVPGYIRICSGNFTKDRQFRYNKCEIFTSVIPRQQELQIYMKEDVYKRQGDETATRPVNNNVYKKFLEIY